MVVFFYKQKTAYEMRISDWSSDVCSSGLLIGVATALAVGAEEGTVPVSALIGFHARKRERANRFASGVCRATGGFKQDRLRLVREDRKSVVQGKGVSVRVVLRGRRIIYKHTNMTTYT